MKWVFMVLGVLGALGAIGLANQYKVFLSTNEASTGSFAGGACGFAVLAGLCFVAAAVVHVGELVAGAQRRSDRPQG